MSVREGVSVITEVCHAALKENKLSIICNNNKVMIVIHLINEDPWEID